MKLEAVGRSALVDAAAELIAAGSARPPELSLPAVGESEGRYVATLRHGDDAAGQLLVARRQGRIEGVVEVRPSPFDETALGVATSRVVGLEATTADAAKTLGAAAMEAARQQGARLVLARVAPASPALGALASEGLASFGATVLYGGPPSVVEEPPAGVAPAANPEDLDAAVAVVQAAWRDSHLSRDPRIDRDRAGAVYVRWVRSEAARGALVLLARDGEGRPAAVAVCRGNPLARELLGLELWHLHLLATHPQSTGRGLGEKVARGASAAGARAGAELMQTGVDTASLAAQRIYARLGLVPRSAGLSLHGWIEQ